MHVDVYSHTHTHTNSCFWARGRRLYCYPWMDENLNATRPLLLKHRLTLSLSLWCLTAVSPHLHLNYIHSSCIYWQEKCGATTADTLSSSLSIHRYRTKHSFIKPFQIISEGWHDLGVTEWLDEGYLPSALDFITVVWSDLGRCLSPVSDWAAVLVSYVWVCVCRSMP